MNIFYVIWTTGKYNKRARRVGERKRTNVKLLTAGEFEWVYNYSAKVQEVGELDTNARGVWSDIRIHTIHSSYKNWQCKYFIVPPTPPCLFFKCLVSV